MDWYHRIAIGDFVTPGTWDQKELEALTSGIDFAHKRVLDVGTLDGKWGFQAATHGAKDVMAVDPCPRPTWEVARNQLFKRGLIACPVLLSPHSLESLAEFGGAKFDLVLDFGVYYHTTDLVKHFQALHQVMESHGLAYVEGEVALDYESSVAKFYPVYVNGDPTTNWVPSEACLQSVIAHAGFDVITSEVYVRTGDQGRIFLCIKPRIL